ncbi:hypothetical protein BT63DRAFT_452245 [Microthyrium microscopicum]|uniref:Uncharacterized protein n=1 Tax=Microthyrium microscopicum TaxID=703497 RepID=A0A6A6UHT2_9PEZI|nr:hypothetical protein BT63DRAFT_452245 [Microthyrium microscopicum]
MAAFLGQSMGRYIHRISEDCITIQRQTADLYTNPLETNDTIEIQEPEILASLSNDERAQLLEHNYVNICLQTIGDNKHQRTKNTQTMVTDYPIAIIKTVMLSKSTTIKTSFGLKLSTAVIKSRADVKFKKSTHELIFSTPSVSFHAFQVIALWLWEICKTSSQSGSTTPITTRLQIDASDMTTLFHYYITFRYLNLSTAVAKIWPRLKRHIEETVVTLEQFIDMHAHLGSKHYLMKCVMQNLVEQAYLGMTSAANEVSILSTASYLNGGNDLEGGEVGEISKTSGVPFRVPLDVPFAAIAHYLRNNDSYGFMSLLQYDVDFRKSALKLNREEIHELGPIVPHKMTDREVVEGLLGDGEEMEGLLGHEEDLIALTDVPDGPFAREVDSDDTTDRSRSSSWGADGEDGMDSLMGL